MLLAAGLDPERCILFRQADVQEHAELCWLLCSVTAYGDLTRMHQFKEKSAREQELVRTSLFLYPVLQAADVLAYKTDEVPVGDDQRQHLELARDIAQRFNATYGEILVVPAHRIPELGARIMDLQDPTVKMSTTYGSEQGLVYVEDEPEAIMRKLKRAQTDSGTQVVRAPDKPGISNLIEILAVAREVVEFLAPVRKRYLEIRPDEQALERTLAQGAERARAIATGTLREVRRAMGVGPPV